MYSSLGMETVSCVMAAIAAFENKERQLLCSYGAP